MVDATTLDFNALSKQIQTWGLSLGLSQIGIADVDLSLAEQRLQEWLEQGRHGSMDFMARHGQKRSRPALLWPGTLRVISARLDYLALNSAELTQTMTDPNLAYIANYAVGRDYHRLLRRRLQRLAELISNAIGSFNYRVFVDSAPVMEKPLAEKAGLGWIGKHTNLINRNSGSWFFLGEIYTNLPLPISTPAINHCGTCYACLKACPTQAIISPYQLDARLCIAYLTIEAPGSIPEALRPLLGNRIFGCDDCQTICPWNRFAQLTMEVDFTPRPYWHNAKLIDLFAWSEAEFLKLTAGSAIRRLGWHRWLRNIAIALGNAPYRPEIVTALRLHADNSNAMVREHVQWALARHSNSPKTKVLPPPPREAILKK